MVKEKLENLAAAVVVLSDIANLPAEYDAELADKEADAVAREGVAYNKGLADGKASMGEPSDKIYSQVELDGIVAPLNESIAAKDLAISAKQAELDQALAESAGKIAEALAGFKAEVKAKFEAAQASENATEAEFAAFLA